MLKKEDDQCLVHIKVSAMPVILHILTMCLNNFHQVILWTKEGPKRLRFEAPDKTVTVKQVVYLDVDG